MYVGEWRNNKKNGQGKMTYKDGSVYYGHWKDDKRHGQDCKMTWTNGTIYEGDFEEDVRHGSGKYIWPNQCYY